MGILRGTALPHRVSCRGMTLVHVTASPRDVAATPEDATRACQGKGSLAMIKTNNQNAP